MPAPTTIYRWISSDKEFAERYAHARELQAEALAGEIVSISDTAVCRDTAAAAKVRVDARKWIASKLLPKKYGEKATEVHANTTVNNFLVLTPDRLQEIQARKAESLRAESLSI